MAKPVCPKCDSARFELQEIEVKGAKYRYNAIICSSCGAVLAVVEYFNTGARLQILAKKLGVALD